jgi:hypothetical protein
LAIMNAVEQYDENKEEVETGRMWRNGNSEDDNDKEFYKNSDHNGDDEKNTDEYC